MGNPPGSADTSTSESSSVLPHCSPLIKNMSVHRRQNSSPPPRNSVSESMILRKNSLVPATSNPDCPTDFAVQLQAASRTYLSKRSIKHSIPASHLPRISSASSLTSLSREARYARAESALRVALSRCETEPSALELQVRILEKGLQAWNSRAGRGYERVQKAEEALAAARGNAEASVARGSFSELQREKWMGMKERDEALEMVEKIKGLIKDIHTDITEGLKASPDSVPSVPQNPSESAEETLSCDTASKKAAILFSGKLPMPYLENLPRSRRSVEPLRLPLHITTHHGRRRSSTLHSEHASSITSSTPTQPSTPHPATPTDDFGAVFIHTPLPLKSVAQYLAEMEQNQETRRVLGHMKLPSYVGALLDELSEDRIGDEKLHIPEVLRQSSHHSHASSKSPNPPPLNHRLRSTGSKGILGRPFSNLPNAPSLSYSPSQDSHSKENHSPSITLHEPSIDSTTTAEKIFHTFPDTTTRTPSPNSPMTSPSLDTTSRKHAIKSPRRVGNLMESVKRGVKKVSRRGD